MRFPVAIRKKSRHPESESKRAMTCNIGTQYSGAILVHNIVVHMAGDIGGVEFGYNMFS